MSTIISPVRVKKYNKNRQSFIFQCLFKCMSVFGADLSYNISSPGGLLICLPREQAARFCAEIKSPKYGEGHQAWIIGIVEKGNRTARIIDKPRIIEVAPQAATQNVNPTPGATS